MASASPQCSEQDVRNELDRLRSLAGPSFVTNFVSAPAAFSPQWVVRDESGSIFLSPEREFFRLMYVAASSQDLAALLKGCEAPGPLVVDVLCREGREPDAVLSALEDAGFTRLSVFRRIRNPQLPVFDRNDRLDFARPGEEEAVLAMLERTFDARNSHFPSLETLSQYIADQGVLVQRRPDDRLCGLSVFHPQGKLCNYDYLVSESEDQADALALLFNTYALLAERGFTAALAWVDETNTGVMRMHTRFGYRPDGTMDITFVKEKLMSLNETVLTLLAELRPEMDFSASSNYLDEGLLDSFDLVTLVSDLDRTFSVSIPGNEILPENFENAEAIVALLKRLGVQGS